jgi:hypothetical protein
MLIDIAEVELRDGRQLEALVRHERERLRIRRSQRIDQRDGDSDIDTTGG